MNDREHWTQETEIHSEDYESNINASDEEYELLCFNREMAEYINNKKY